MLFSELTHFFSYCFVCFLRWGLPSKDDVLSKLSLATRFESTTAALGDGGSRTSEDLFRHGLDSLSAPTSLTTSLFSPAEQQSAAASGITPCHIPRGIDVFFVVARWVSHHEEHICKCRACRERGRGQSCVVFTFRYIWGEGDSSFGAFSGLAVWITVLWARWLQQSQYLLIAGWQ